MANHTDKSTGPSTEDQNPISEAEASTDSVAADGVTADGAGRPARPCEAKKTLSKRAKRKIRKVSRQGTTDIYPLF